jgi:hypothetical protein
MSRSGYSDDYGDDDPLALGRYRAQVASAIRGKRGQALLRELLAALDAMPDKRLVAGELEADGQFCALGVVGQARGLDLANIDTYDVESMGPKFNIAEQLAREIMWINDESVGRWKWVATGLPYPNEWKRVEVTNAGEDRFQVVREWVAKNIKAEGDQARTDGGAA